MPVKPGATAMLATVVPAEFAEAFKRIADSHDRSVSAEMRRVLREYVEAHQPSEEVA